MALVSLAAFYQRVGPSPEEMELILRAGVFDEFAKSRTALFWERQFLRQTLATVAGGLQGLQLDPLESRANSKTLTSSDKNYTFSVGYDNRTYWSPLVLRYLYAPCLHLSIAEYEQLSKKAVNEAAKNNTGL
jgi:hypothetical protein